MTEEQFLYAKPEKLKDNKIDIVFICEHDKKNPCVYFQGFPKNQNLCKYAKSYFCRSLVAQVNKMTVKIKQIKGK